MPRPPPICTNTPDYISCSIYDSNRNGKNHEDALSTLANCDSDSPAGSERIIYQTQGQGDTDSYTNDNDSPRTAATSTTVLTLKNDIVCDEYEENNSNHRKGENYDIKRSAKRVILSGSFTFIIIYAIFTTVSCVSLFVQNMKIPELKDASFLKIPSDIQNLTEQVNRLHSEIDMLEKQNIHLSSNISVLEEKNIIYKNLNNQYEKNLTDLTESNDVLSEQISDLKDQNDILNVSIKNYDSLNVETEILIGILEDENEKLEGHVITLENQTSILSGKNQELSIHSMNLKGNLDRRNEQHERIVKYNLNITRSKDRLTELVWDLSNQTALLGNHLDILSDQVSFLNDTTVNEYQEYKERVQILRSGIQKYRKARVGSLMNLWNVHQTSYRRNMEIRFYGSPILSGVPLLSNLSSSEYYDSVLSWMEEEYWDEMCVDILDFLRFMKEEVIMKNYDEQSGGEGDKEVITIDTIVDATFLYREGLNRYYFPLVYDDDSYDEESKNNTTEIILSQELSDRKRIYTPYLTLMEWEEAKYRCECIPQHRKYCYYGNCTWYNNTDPSYCYDNNNDDDEGSESASTPDNNIFT